VSRKSFMNNFLALDKPWLYLVFCFYFLTLFLVWMDNPLLPIQALAKQGWAWHHIPEILSFFFLGMYLGSLGYLSLESFTYLDSFALFLIALVGIIYAEIISYIMMFPIVLTIVFIPSFLGYFTIRLYKIKETKRMH
jgi:hypothetical protein